MYSSRWNCKLGYKSENKSIKEVLDYAELVGFSVFSVTQLRMATFTSPQDSKQLHLGFKYSELFCKGEVVFLLFLSLLLKIKFFGFCFGLCLSTILVYLFSYILFSFDWVSLFHSSQISDTGSQSTAMGTGLSGLLSWGVVIFKTTTIFCCV